MTALTLAAPEWSRRRATPAETALVSVAEPQPPSAEELCEEHFRTLARAQPAVLVRWMQTVLREQPELLTFAAEAAGLIEHPALVLHVLRPLLAHEKAFVREGAVYGLTPHLESSIDARDLLRDQLRHEPSPGVRAAIHEALAALE